jgi:Protein of unknown function (DUF2934)
LIACSAHRYHPAAIHTQRSVALMTPDNQPKTKTTKAAAKTTKAAAKTTKAAAKTTKAPAKTTKAPAKTRSRPAPSHEAIARRAHELYEAQGGGDPVANWLQAQRDLSSH